MSEIKIALVGVGNCAASLVEGIALYSSGSGNGEGLRSERIGGYTLGDIKVVAAFDVSVTKVGKDLSEAIHGSPNRTVQLSEVHNLGVEIMRGPTLDGISETCRSDVRESSEQPVNVADVLRR